MARYGRSKAEGDAEVAYYHCISRVVDRNFILLDQEREHFVELMRMYETFCGVKVVTFCIMTTHFHLLVKVPHRPAQENLPTDEQLVRLVKIAKCSYHSVELAKDLERLRANGDDARAEEIRERFFARMWDISAFMKALKQRFSQWYNGRKGRAGTLWEDRFKSVLVEGLGEALATMAAYIDLNPVRAGMVEDPTEYRWCGYGQAVAGQKLAREGIGIAVEALREEVTLPNQVMAAYRKYLFEEGVARAACEEDGTAARKGFSPERVEAVIAAGGELELHDALRCRVRYFCDGAVFGSQAFVEKFFQNNRQKFSLKRQSGARAMRHVNLPGLFTVRDLRLRVVHWRA